jgi:hypothetical protein
MKKTIVLMVVLGLGLMSCQSSPRNADESVYQLGLWACNPASPDYNQPFPYQLDHHMFDEWMEGYNECQAGRGPKTWGQILKEAFLSLR